MSKAVESIASYLETLEDSKFSKKSHTMALMGLNTVLQGKDIVVTPQEVMRILAVFQKCMKEEIILTPHVLTAVTSLLTNAKVVQEMSAQDLLPSALAVLAMLRSTSGLKLLDNLRYLGMQVFLAFPTGVLNIVIKYHITHIIKLFEVYWQKADQPLQDLNKSAYYILKGLLAKLPQEEKLLFLEKGTSLWFSDLIPLVMNSDNVNSPHYISYLKLVETLVEDFVEVDYFKHPLWTHQILCSVCDSRKYPGFIKDQLENNSDVWHRLWIVLVKLLKTQMTRSCPYGTPIQFMLGVVETGFKMDSHKVRAFQCWDNLIEILATDTSTKCVPRYIKLLLIPLKVNNAKTEQTVEAKFNTWWKLIQKFQNKLDKYADDVVITFIQFAFGKTEQSKNSMNPLVASHFKSLSHLCLQAFVQIVGHDRTCNCCTDLPELTGKFLTIKLLMSHLDDWMHALKETIITTYNVLNSQDVVANESMQILCIWNAFVKLIAELPPNGVRSDLINKLLQILANCVHNQKEGTTDAIYSVILSVVLSLMDNDESIKNMLTCNDVDSPLKIIVDIILHPNMAGLFLRYGSRKISEMLKPLTDMFVQSQNIDWLMKNCMLYKSPAQVTTKCILWIALTQSIIDSKQVTSLNVLSQVLKWPMKAAMKFVFEMDDYSASLWRTLYSAHADNLSQNCFEEEIFTLLCNGKNETKNLSYFRFVVSVSMLKQKLIYEKDIGAHALKLEEVTKAISDYKLFEPSFPMLVDTIVMLVSKVSSSEDRDTKIASTAVKCVENVLQLMVPQINVDETGPIKLMLNNLIQAVNEMSAVSEYKNIACKCLETYGKLKGIVHSTSDASRQTSNREDTNRTPSQLQNVLAKDSSNNSKIIKEFTSPNVKIKKSRKEASIVKTVVENGEEYVVVKSNWKFNPKKLTENQKEKLQRKREDIPALYQDLSQSQDEFKLKSWKTDSQDTITSSSTSNSKSITSNQTTNENASNILKTIASFEVVPNIIKNIMPESDKNNTMSNTTNATNPKEKSSKIEPITPKNSKSPRMALKDRVFRNVRNLIEKSSPRGSTLEVTVEDCQLNNIPKTPPPTENKNNADSIQSAPSALFVDRPSRMKRKPKKFDDVQLFGLKKKRYSQSDSIPNSTHNTEITDKELTKNSDLDSEKEANTEQNQNNKDVCMDEAQIKEDEFHQDNYNNIEDPVIENKAQNILNETIPDNTQNDDHEKEKSVETKEQEAVINNEPKSNEYTEKADYTSIQNQTREEDQNIETIKIAQNLLDNCELQNVENNSDVQIHDNEEKSDCMTSDNRIQESNNVTDNNDANETDTLKTPVIKTNKSSQKSYSTGKKSTTRKSRLEKELAIDMVAGHPFLEKQVPDKRLTRNKLLETEGKRKSCPNDASKTKTASKLSPRFNKKAKDTDKLSPNASQISSVTVEETQEKISPIEDLPCSEDIIESSQDSTLTTISVKSAKRTPKRVPIVTVEKLESLPKRVTDTQDLLQDSENDVLCETNASKSVNNSKDDIELPQNKTAEVNKNVFELTEVMDTEPVLEKFTDDVIIINDEQSPIKVSSENIIGQETQDIADADTQPNNPADFAVFESTDKPLESHETANTALDVTEPMTPNKFMSQNIVGTQKYCSKVNTEPSLSKTSCNELDTDVCSPFKDDTERKQDFLNNTSEISPIKVQSPDKEKSPEKREETSSDYLVVKLSSPVHSNGEPYHSGSPEFFSEDKLSPDKRDQSPPRAETSSSSGSPSTSLSLKKNRPQTKRSGGRAAQMLGLLCISETLKHSDRTEPEEPKKVSTSTPARRNLRVLYNAVGDKSDNNSEEDEQVNFLKLKKCLPAVDSSPSVPILKRKLDVVEDNTASPAGKRKRVSFHDPPVSTTVSVQKYIEPLLNRSPSSSHKRLITRTLTKSPKRLDSVFKLDTVLSKAVESFSEPMDSLSIDTNMSLDVTPAVEVVNTTELNDTDPICAALVDCKDPIESIALELSSPAMKELLIKELDGKVVTIGDLAKMTELEVNRLCIKAPKVQVAKKVLDNYAANKNVPEVVNITETNELEDETAIATEMDEEMTEPEGKNTTIDTQTDIVVKCDADAQTTLEVKLASTQTHHVPNEDASAQTIETGSKTTSEIISSCLVERPDFVERLGELIPANKLVEMLTKQPEFNNILVQVLDHRGQNMTKDDRTSTELDFFKELLCQRFGSKDLIRFCSRVLDSAHDKLG